MSWKGLSMTKRFLVHPFVMLGLGVLLIVGAGCESVGLRSMKIYIQQRNWEKALEQGNIALAENPNDAEAWFAMAQVAAQVDSFDLMLRAIERTESLTNKHAADFKLMREAKYGSAFNMGVERYNANDMAGASRFMDIAISIDSTRANAYRLKGMIAQRAGNTQETLQYFDRAYRADTTDVELARVYAQLLDAMGKRNEALSVAQRLYAARPGEKKTVALYLQLLTEAGRFEEALNVVNTALASDPNNAEYNMRAGVLWMQRAQQDVADSTAIVRDLETAAPYFEAAVEADTANTDAAYNLAVCYARLNRRGDAINVMKRLLSVRPNDYQARIQLGTLYVREENPDAAEQEFLAVVESIGEPTNAEDRAVASRAYRYLSTIYTYRGAVKQGEADRLRERAQELINESAMARQRTVRQQKEREAQALLQQAEPLATEAQALNQRSVEYDRLSNQYAN